MISITVSGNQTTSAYALLDYTFSGQGGAVTILPPIFTHDVQGESFTKQYTAGNLHEGTETWGRLRDHEVDHLFMKGDVFVDVSSDPPSLPPNSGVAPFGADMTVTELLDPGTSIRRISGDDYQVWEEAQHLCLMRVFHIGQYVVQTFTHVAPRTLKQRIWPPGPVSLVSEGGAFHTINVWVLASSGELYNSQRHAYVGADSESFFAGIERYYVSKSGLGSYLEDFPHYPSSIQSPVWSGSQEVIDPAGYEHVADNVASTVIPSMDFVYRKCWSSESDADMWGDLALECSDQLRVSDTNFLVNIQDAVEIADLAKSVKKLLTDPRGLRLWRTFLHKLGLAKGPVDPRQVWLNTCSELGSAYLGYKFGLEPMLDDLRKMLETAQKTMHGSKQEGRLHSRRTRVQEADGHVVTRQSVLTVEIGQFPDWFFGDVARAIQRAGNLGLGSGLEVVYDLTKFTWLLDYILTLGGFFEDTDNFLRTRDYFPIKYCIQSDKWSFTASATQLTQDNRVRGEVTFGYYSRWISGELPLPPISAPRFGSGLTLSQGGILTALWVQKW